MHACAISDNLLDVPYFQKLRNISFFPAKYYALARKFVEMQDCAWRNRTIDSRPKCEPYVNEYKRSHTTRGEFLSHYSMIRTYLGSVCRGKMSWETLRARKFLPIAVKAGFQALHLKLDARTSHLLSLILDAKSCDHLLRFLNRLQINNNFADEPNACGMHSSL